MTKSKESLSVFLLQFLERLNGHESIEKKITKSLIDICNYYGFKKGFVYQTDGFRYFFLKETIGNEDNTLRFRFEMGEMTTQHSGRIEAKRNLSMPVRVRKFLCLIWIFWIFMEWIHC